ncbi:MAG: RloB domain-containing protein [Sphaerochaetaceae bacterium]|nr:RloB domain-containing protein [Sphaerochaetaceae bacterium]
MAKSDRKGIRKTRDKFQTRFPVLGYYFIVTDAKETEENYLYGLRDNLLKDLQARIVIKVSRVKTNELVSVCKEQAAMEPQFGEPWIVFDRDQVIDFDKIIETAKQKNVNVGWSNPCIEIWFDSYFGKMHSYQDSTKCCHEFAETFKKKTGQEYNKSSRDIYSVLNKYGNEIEAIKIAESRLNQYLRDEINKSSEMCPCTTLHQLITEINRKAGRTI